MRRRGFTLIELLVVVGIIVILLAIVIPSLSQFKNKAAKTQCQALLSNIASSIMAYHSRFGAYPGPAALETTADGSASKAIDGSQNMLLGLSYGMSPKNISQPRGTVATLKAPTLPTTPDGKVYVDTGSPQGPRDLGSVRPDGSTEQLSPFFVASNNQVATPEGLNGNSSKFPVVVDSFPDALPVLYFRRTPGIDNPVSAKRNPNTPAGYVLEENSDILTSTTLKAVGGRTMAQAKAGPDPYSAWSTMDAAAENDFKVKVLNNSNQARGGFVLVSAGLDRVYGSPKNSTSGALGTFDDVVVVGGE